MSTQGARNCEVGTCHGKGTSFEVTSVLTAARPYNNLASLGFSILMRSLGVSVYTLRVVIRIHESRYWMRVSECWFPYAAEPVVHILGTRRTSMIEVVFYQPLLPRGGTSYRYLWLCVAAGTHRPNIYNSEYLRVPWGGGNP